ncbi:acetylxylan esterase [Plantactinospora sp. GCM10030261]|uniref:acetylxylan esterase n=1 Tax=Plantactinospora sp. GCM10030261 TaxID=3273420 RepID=UPI003619FABA
MLVDWPLDRLRDYHPARDEPADFDEFWAGTLRSAEEAGRPARFDAYPAGLATVEVFDVTLAGYAGQPVRGWLLLPRGGAERLPCVVQYIGYSNGRGLPHDWLFWSAAGYANLVVDTRGQGGHGRLTGDTADPEGAGPHANGFLTKGIEDPARYYYRRVFTDAVRAVAAAREHPRIDPDRVLVAGTSQGGGIAIAVGGLVDGLAAVLPDVPFLCHYRRATEITDTEPYAELTRYLHTRRHMVDQVFETLGYFDGVNFAARMTAPTLFSVALMDAVCPPSTVFAAYNRCASADKDITVWPYNGHEGGESYQSREQLRWLGSRLPGAA